MATTAKKKGLGRGLSALLGDDRPNIEGPVTGMGESRQELPLAYLERNPDQPRRTFDQAALDDLASSIREQGILQPILVRKQADNKYQIIAGERRWRAAQQVGLHHVPVIIREVDNERLLELAIIENIQREDLSPIEEGRAYKQLMEEFDHTQDKTSEMVGKSRSHVANLMRLLSLPDDVQKLVDDKALSMGHARALLGADDAVTLAAKIVADGLSVRQTEALVRGKTPTKEKTNRQGERRATSVKDADTIALEKDLTAAIGASVTIDHKPDGNGLVIINYDDLEGLDRICALLGVCGVE